eukprot:scaffold47_cov258-Pinguiococcus_pyrenoidosus.AAC.67
MDHTYSLDALRRCSRFSGAADSIRPAPDPPSGKCRCNGNQASPSRWPPPASLGFRHDGIRPVSGPRLYTSLAGTGALWR